MAGHGQNDEKMEQKALEKVTDNDTKENKSLGKDKKQEEGRERTPLWK